MINMSGKVEKTEEKVDHVSRIREQCVNCFKGPNLIKTIVVMACLIIVVYQIITCIQKLTNIPVTTHTHFDFNKTIAYPSVTFCREPPYKHAKLQINVEIAFSKKQTKMSRRPTINTNMQYVTLKTHNVRRRMPRQQLIRTLFMKDPYPNWFKILEYGLSSHPRFTSTWREFNFSAISLDELWDEITYNADDFFVQYGLDSLRDDVVLTPSMGFVNGRCYTLTPRIKDSQATKARGYTITLQHTQEDITSSTSILPPGYHVYVHYEKEPYTEVEVYNGGLVDYLYINTGETLDVKLTVNEYVMISDELNPCSTEPGYSANYCTTLYVWEEVGRQVNCSGPWMNISLQRCDNFSDMRRLISAYMDKYINHTCESCPRVCRSLLYSAFVVDRQKFYTWDAQSKVWASSTSVANLQTQIYIHFNNMMVSVFEEKYNYDWNVFLSDLGGSVGFLLGLSVIGLIGILGNMWSNMVRPLLCASAPVPTPLSVEVTPRKTRPYSY